MAHHAAIMAPGMPINIATGSATIRLDSTAAVTRHSGAIEAAQSTPRNRLGTWIGQAAVDLDVVWAKLAAMAEGARLEIFAAAARRSTKPHYLLTTRPGVMDRALVGILREHRVAAVGGFREGLMAIDRLARKPVWLGEHSRPTCRSSRRGKAAVERFETVLAAGQSRWKIPVTGGAGYWR
jgi:hypothetical protein